MKGRPFALGCMLLVFAVASPADAQRAPPPPPLAQSLGEEARPLYAAGVTLYRSKQFDAALAQFRAAYNKEADPRLLWNMAVCEKNLSRFVVARILTDEYLDRARNSLSEAERVEATQFAASLRSFVAVVHVRTTPAAATVFIDGVERGKSPLDLELDMGEHKLRVALSGRKELERVERFEGASERTLEWKLEPNDSRLSVTGAHAHKVSVNGRAVGMTPWDGVLPPGAYEVEVSDSGYKPRRTQVTLAASETRTLDVDLEPLPKTASRWPWVVGIGVVVAGAGVAGFFLLRPTHETQSPTPSTLGSHSLP